MEPERRQSLTDERCHSQAGTEAAGQGSQHTAHGCVRARLHMKHQATS